MGHGVVGARADEAPPRSAAAFVLDRLGVVRSPGALRDAHVAVALAAAVPVLVALSVFAAGGERASDARALAGFLLVQPVVEELLFRGLLQGELRRTRWGRSRACGVTAANAATSLLFCAAHLAGQAPAWAAAVLVPSLVLGHLRDRLGTVLPSLVVHVAYNAAFLAATVR